MLRPMTEAEFPAYLERLVAVFAEDLMHAGNAATPQDAQVHARASCESLLPQGLNSSNQHLFVLETPEVQEPVGVLWLGVVERPGYLEAYIYDIEVYAPYRRRGYATRALEAAAREGRARGASKIGLHVFGYNTAAIALYEQAGFQVTNLWMARDIPPED